MSSNQEHSLEPKDDDSEIPEEKVIDQRTITFLDDDLAVALGESGNIYCSLPGMSNALGLNTQAQSRRITRTKLLRSGLTSMRLKTSKRGLQKTLCFRIDLIASWLIGAETGNMRPGAAEKIDEYQTRLAPTAMHVFLDTMGISSRGLLPPPSEPLLPAGPRATDEQIIELRRQYVETLGTLNLMREAIEIMTGEIGGKLDDILETMQHILSAQDQQGRDIKHLKTKTQGLTPAQKQHVTFAIKTIVEDSSKTNNPIGYQQAYAILYRHFKVSSYADIPESQFDTVITFLRDLWKQVTDSTKPEQGDLL